jgi:hypothetical protein
VTAGLVCATAAVVPIQPAAINISRPLKLTDMSIHPSACFSTRYHSAAICRRLQNPLSVYLERHMLELTSLILWRCVNFGIDRSAMHGPSRASLRK